MVTNIVCNTVGAYTNRKEQSAHGRWISKHCTNYTGNKDKQKTFWNIIHIAMYRELRRIVATVASSLEGFQMSFDS